jgi:biotin-dependent carboxylase-like uncharacterized protein
VTTVLEVKFCGPSVSVQDIGRRGFMRYGIPHSGPMDRTAFAVLAAALDAPKILAAVEVSIAGIELVCSEGSVTAAFIGGEFAVSLDGTKLAPWSVFTLERGMTLTIRSGRAGSWGYLGFVGDMDTDEWLGSRSNYLTSGLCGRSFAAGDQIKIADAAVKRELHAAMPIPAFAKFAGFVRAVLGPQDEFFSNDAITSLTNTSYRISAESNRMGMRLKGTKLKIKEKLTMLSEALLPGAVQVPGHGDPIVLLADHQTTGGYPKIATVISSDLNRLVQARVDNELRFSILSVDRAVAAVRKQQTELSAYLTTIPSLRGTLRDRLLRSNLISGVFGG